MDTETAILSYKGKEYSLPVIKRSDQQAALDIRQLHEQSQLYAYDPLLNNVALAESAITRIDSEKNKLYYRGYDLEELVEHSHFIELAYLLMYGELPKPEEHKNYSLTLGSHSMIHESMRNFFDGFPGDAHPLAILATMVTALSSYYPSTYEEHIRSGIDIKARLLSKVRTLAAWAYKKSIGQPIVYPRDKLSYCANFLNMMFSVPAEEYSIAKDDERLLNQVLILYSDHEQNIATTTVRLIGSSQANLFVCINAGISALWGAREAAWEVHTMSMLNTMLNHNMKAERFFEKFIKGEEALRSPAFGHKKYHKMGPRAQSACKLFHAYLKNHPQAAQDPIIAVALEVEEFVLGQPYFSERNLLPNLDFYSALLLQTIGIPESMFNVVRVIGKLAGWLAHWEEQHKSLASQPSMRPQQIYCGSLARPYLPIDKR